MFSSASPFLVAIVALIPGIAAWWTARRIARHTSDPALPELLFARSQRLTSISTTSFVAMAFIGGRHAYWGIVLLLAASIVGGYPLRRTLGIETDGLLRHLWRSAKSIVGGLGFWLLLLMTPEIIVAIDARYRLFALVLIPILFAWEIWYPRLWLWLHDSTPLANPEITPRIDAVVQRAGIPAPRVYRIGGAGTRFMNALAFPSVKHPCIGLGNALVDLLEPDEVAAIYAHELSHIEQYSPRKIRRLQLLNRVLIIVGVVAPLVALRISPSAALLLPWLWLALLVGTMIWRSRQRKQQETESDARAAALCGDPEVVIRALIKVHVHGFIPRRWSVDFERGATHPSLARRIQALRGENAASLSTVDAPRVLATARDGSTVVFDNTRAHWFDGVPAGTSLDFDSLRAAATSSRSVAWPDLIELRIETKGDGRALKAAHKNGDSWSVPLDTTHVEPMQKALDVMDVRLHRDLGKAPILGTRLMSAMLVVAILWAGELGVLIVPAMLAIFRPSSAGLAALGVMSFFGAALEGISRWSMSGPGFRLLVLAGLGLAAMWMAWYRVRHEKKRDGVLITAALFGIVAAVTLVLGLTAISGEFSLIGVAKSSMGTAFALSVAAVGAALVIVPRRTAKWGAGAAAGLALVSAEPSVAASGAFDASAFTRRRSDATEIGRVTLGSRVGGLQLSPDGSRFIAEDFDYDRDPRARSETRFTIGAVGGATRELEASQAAFADDQHLLILRETENGAELRLERADTSVVWIDTLPRLRAATLTIAPHDRTWAIVANEPKMDTVVVITGFTDKPDFNVRRFANDRTTGGARGAFNSYERIVIGDRVIVAGFDVEGMSTSSSLLGMRPRVDLWEITASGRKSIARLDAFPHCGPPDDGRATCVVRTRYNRGQVWTIERTGPAKYIGDVPFGEIGMPMIGPGPRITGAARSTRVLDVDVDARRYTDIRLPTDMEYLSDVRTAPGRLAVLRQDINSATLVFYRVP